MLIELILSIPARLSDLLVVLTSLMRPLVMALQEGQDLVGLGLRTLEYWVDRCLPPPNPPPPPHQKPPQSSNPPFSPSARAQLFHTLTRPPGLDPRLRPLAPLALFTTPPPLLPCSYGRRWSLSSTCFLPNAAELVCLGPVV